MAMGELVVSELVSNAYKYAPGPCLLDLEVSDGAVEISVWGTDPTLPSACPVDPVSRTLSPKSAPMCPCNGGLSANDRFQGTTARQRPKGVLHTSIPTACP